MKRMIHSLLAAAVLVSAMTCTAFAGDYTADKNDDAAKYVGTVTTADEGKSFTVSYDKATAGEQYAVLIVKLNSDGTYNAADENNIIYINQDAAASDGTITFEGLIPMTSANAIVLLGGVFAGQESPVILGELKVPYVLGNVNSDYDEETGDALIDIEDALAILRYDVELIELDGTQMLAANVNQDTDDDGNPLVDIEDALRILRYDVELITYEEMIAPAG